MNTEENTSGADETATENLAEEANVEKTVAPEDEFKNRYFYLAAEMDNMKKRFDREKENIVKFGNEKILSGLVGVVDNLELTISAIEKDQDEKVKNIVKGIQMIRGQFVELLKNNGLEQVHALGKVFDPNFHEAVAQAPAEGKKDQEVITEYQKGYVLNGRLLRAAKVVVANNI